MASCQSSVGKNEKGRLTSFGSDDLPSFLFSSFVARPVTDTRWFISSVFTQLSADTS